MAASLTSLRQRPLLFITTTFVAWKSMLFITGLTCPGIGYDTSTSLLERPTGGSQLSLPNFLSLVLKLVRWDAIYYIQISQRGHLFEQEWAFGMGLSTLVSKFKGVLFGLYWQPGLEHHAVTGILISLASHYLSTILLWQIACQIWHGNVGGFQASTNVPTISALLHILSPAGIFLAAPYSESTFSFLNFLGFWLYLKGRSFETRKRSLREMILTIGAGAAFGLATIVRGNGVLSGLPLLQDAVVLFYALLFPKAEHMSRIPLFLSLATTVLAGCLIAVGLALPQFVAYREYCTFSNTQRPWCQKPVPLIYEFVQSHYWNVGFLRYWALSNFPLFLLASPCLFLLLQSGIGALSFRAKLSAHPSQTSVLHRLAVPQLVLAMLAITNYHVQIITRLSSGYPWWYMWLAAELQTSKFGELAVRYFVLYALIQAALFASFLPPA